MEDNRDAPVDAEVLKAVHDEISQSLSTVKEMEADAEKRGIPLNLSGARYRIYETTKPVV